MTQWKLAELNDVADLQAGFGFPIDLQGRSSGHYPFAKVGDISRHGRAGNRILSHADHYVDEADLSKLKAKIVRPGSTLFAKIGEAIRQNHRVMAGCPLFIDNNAMAAMPRDNVDPGYLYRFLQTVDLYRYASSTTVPALRKSELQRIPIPLPPLPDQRRIAAVLDHVDTIRMKRRVARARLDELTQAIFLEMFGDPYRNPRSLKIVTLNEVTEIQGGLTVSAARTKNPEEVPYLRVANVLRGKIDLSQVKTLRATESEINRTRLSKGDLLIVEGHGNPNEIGRVAMWDGSFSLMSHQNHLIRARCKSQIIPRFAEFYLNSQGGRRHLLRSAKTTSGLNTISTTQVKKTPIYLPPVDEQLEFDSRIAAIDEIRYLNCQSEEKFDLLFSSLQSRAFRGEL